MTNEQRETLFNRLMQGAEEQCAGKNTPEYQIFATSTIEDLDAIEPLIDEFTIPFHTIMQLVIFLKFHEWHEARPGYVNCPECNIEFQATLPAARHHRAHCRVGELIKILQAKLKTSEGSNENAISDNTPNTTR